MARAAIKGTAAGGEQGVETGGRGGAGGLFRQVQPQPTFPQQTQRAGCEVRQGGAQVVAVAIGRRVDQQQQTFGGAVRDLAHAAILRADIDGRRRGDFAAAEDRVEFLGVVLGEEDVVVGQRETRCRDIRAPGDGRKRACGIGRVRCGVAWRIAHQAARKGRYIAVEDHRIGLDPLTVRQTHAHGAAIPHQDLLHLRAAAEHRALSLGQGLQRLRHADHAAAHQPHPVLFHMRDQHQRRGGEEGRTAAIGRVAAEQLAQPGVAEILAERPPHRPPRRRPPQRIQPPPAHAVHEVERGWAFAGDEGANQGPVDVRAAGAEIEVAACLGRPGEIADGVG